MEAAGKALQNLKYKITGQKYHNNLLGESLEDMMRIATAKTLEAPDTATNQQVVDTINQEIAGGKDPKDVVTLIKGRLRMDNPQKQFLAVKLTEQILSDCSVLSVHQQEVLQEIARVMARPAKPETDAGKRARQAAKELLRKYGQEGTSAFRAVHHEDRPRGPPTQYPAYHGGTQPTPHGYPGAYGAPPAAYPAPGVNIERQSLIEEVQQLIGKARSNTELLSDMLVNTSAVPDEFEAELVKDLVTDVRELREVFNAYLEQISVMEGPDMEALVVQALEAVDMLDGAMALQKDVQLNQQQELAASQGGAPAAAAAAGTSGAGSSYSPAPAAAAPAKKSDDLIALDDLAEAMTAPAAVHQAAGSSLGGTQSYDPFAASDTVPIFQGTGGGTQGGTGPAAPPAAAGAAAPVQPASAFAAGVFSDPGVYASLAAAAPTAAAPYLGMPPQHYGGMSVSGSTPGYAPPQHYGGIPVPQQQQQQQQAYGMPPQQQPYGMPQQQQQQQYGMPQQQQQQYGATVPVPQHAAPFGVAVPQPYAQLPPSVLSPSSSNPFTDSFSALALGSGGGAGMGAAAGTSNPFGAALPAQAPAAAAAAPGVPAPHTVAAAAGAPAGATVDQEWDLFFADRAAGGAPAAQAAKP